MPAPLASRLPRLVPTMTAARRWPHLPTWNDGGSPVKAQRNTGIIMSTYAVATLGAVVRLTRFVVLDDLGHWLIKRPLQQVAFDHDIKAHHRIRTNEDMTVQVTEPDWTEDTDTMPTAVRAAHGLSCPFCVSTWLGIGAVAIALAAWPHPRARNAWLTVAGGLTASYLTGHIVDRLDLHEETDDA